MSFLSRLFGKTESSAEILCPHCEKAMEQDHDVDACARKRMSRRFFFGVMGGAAVASVIVPPLAPTLLSLDEFAGLYIQPAMIQIANSIDRKIGDTIRVRKPPRFIARYGMTFNPSSIHYQKTEWVLR